MPGRIIWRGFRSINADFSHSRLDGNLVHGGADAMIGLREFCDPQIAATCLVSVVFDVRDEKFSSDDQPHP